MLNVSFEPMTDAEFGEFMELIVPAYVDERARADHVPREVAERFSREQHARLLPEGRLTADHYFFRIAADGLGPRLGGVWLFVDRAARHAFLYNITVLPPFRRQGVATAALVRLQEVARQLGCTLLALNVFATNSPAMDLYRRLGFEVVSSHMNKRL